MDLISDSCFIYDMHECATLWRLIHHILQIKLYDHRLTKRGPVQSYAGQVNTHTHLQLATDANERFLMSGSLAAYFSADLNILFNSLSVLLVFLL